MDIRDVLEENKPIIDKMIEKYIPRKYNDKSMAFTSGKPRYGYSKKAVNASIADPVWNLLDRGGKRWRPVLFLLTLEALSSKENTKKFLDFVVIPEVVHSGSLLVDDIEDNSDLRRGKPCVHKIYGEDIAINAGNAMYFLPLLTLIKRTDLDDWTARRIYDIYAQEMVNISMGQGYDIAWHKGLADADDVSEKEYLQMCAFKTGTLARMSARIAAALAKADDETMNKFGYLAEAIGVGFQIQDDILNLTATSGENQFTEEYLGSDISEGKRTLMVIHTLKKAKKSDKKRLIAILEMHSKDRAVISEAIEIIKKYGAVDYAKQFARNLVQKAWDDVKDVVPESNAKQKLYAFVKFMVEREY